MPLHLLKVSTMRQECWIVPLNINEIIVSDEELDNSYDYVKVEEKEAGTAIAAMITRC